MKVEIIEGEACPDHIHLLVSTPPYMSIAQFVGTLKSKSALMIFDRRANLNFLRISEPFPVWRTVKMEKKQNETEDILRYLT